MVHDVTTPLSRSTLPLRGGVALVNQKPPAGQAQLSFKLYPVPPVFYGYPHRVIPYVEECLNFQAGFEESLAKTLTWKVDSAMTQALQKRFRAVRLFDSTYCACSEALAQLFPGCGSAGSTAGIKVLLSYEYGASRLEPLEVLPGKGSDQGLSQRVCQEVGPGELGIFDKGFYKAQSLAAIDQRRGYKTVRSPDRPLWENLCTHWLDLTPAPTPRT